MNTLRRRTRLPVVLAALQLWTWLWLSFLPYAQAQAYDTEPPLIEHEAISEALREEAQVFTANVVDDNELQMVMLRYRVGNESAYTGIEMNPIGASSLYSASLDMNFSGIDRIEYYIEARDAGGNRSLRGFAFEPLTRHLVDSTTLAVQSNAGAMAEANAVNTRRNLWIGLAAVLVLGAVVSGSGGGGGSDGPLSDPANPEVPLNIVIEEVQGGS